MRTKIIAGNWKMNLTLTESTKLIHQLNFSSDNENIRVLVIPPFTNLEAIKRLLKNKNSKIEVAAQNLHHSVSGAYTGEISARMLKDIGVDTAIVGHSERRTLFAENDETISLKASSALSQNLEIIYCFGESLIQRKRGIHFEIIARQLDDLIHKFETQYWRYGKIILAYEPVWAIGTGQTASKEQAQEMHQFIRHLIGKEIGEDLATKTPILYGGSVKPENATELFQQPDVDGGLIGGASLNADSFNLIIQSIAENC
ncbi:MAG: triose-phosphate isomerase [Flavobacteriaceae bacterium]|nr:triose-phosphate isomerase [Flavobacteriaceae bacterium]